jgi:hypothetical protein
MSVMERREQAEREVLASLLLLPSTFEELPEGFKNDAFEFPEYKQLFESLNDERKKTSTPLDIKECLLRLPDKRRVIDDVTFAAIPLNGRFRGAAQRLINHIPIAIEPEENNATLLNSGYSKESQCFQFENFTALDIAMMEIPKESFLIKNLISDMSVNFLMGEEGCGKSLLAMNLALSIAVGAKQWLSYDIEKHGKVLFLNNELSFPDYARRLKTMVERLPALGDISNLIIPKEVPAIDECWQTLNEACDKEKPCLIVVDCLYFTHNKDENDSSEMKALMRQFLALRDRYGLAVLIVHHTKKGSQYQRMHNDQMRGSNVFGGSADTTLQIRRSSSDEGKRIIKPLKGRHIPDDMRKCRLLSLDPISLWFKDEGETNEGEHIAMEIQTAQESIDFKSVFGDAKELSRKEIQERCKPLGYDERTIDRLLKQAKGKGILNVPKYGFYAL